KKSLEDLVLREMQTRNYSHRSIGTYIHQLNEIEKYYKCSIDEVNSDQVKNFLQYSITERNLSVSYINQVISAVKILQQDVLGKSWESIRIKRPRGIKRLPVVLSKEEIKSIIETTRNLKHRAILAVIYSAGLRIAEVISLLPSDIDSDRKQVRVQGKGNKYRYTLLSENTLNMLRMYWRAYRPVRYLFEGQKKGQPISRETIQKVFKESCKRAGVKKQATIHSLRHSFATHLLENGVNLKIIQGLLGHSSLRTTSIYLHVTRLDLASVKSPFDEIAC
ncbi:MAG TPA: tyrosine-type recombinase/integrase, partial [Candidatus Dojkabacteria bacterium]|nr:tyrosine-type recombinase/integrase [Candidatus Dojkabacteria bacterium]